MLTAQEAFKIGFLSRCVEDQLTPDQMLMVVKRASDLLEKNAVLGVFSGLGGKMLDVGKGVAGGALNYGIPLAVAGPPIVGGLAGYGLARATDIDQTDIDEIKDREVIDAYRRETERLKRQKSVREYAKSKATSGRIFL